MANRQAAEEIARKKLIGADAISAIALSRAELRALNIEDGEVRLWPNAKRAFIGALIPFLEVKTWISLTSTPAWPNWSAFFRIKIMVFELAVLFAVVALMGAIIVKVYEWRQDVLYGPYLRRFDDHWYERRTKIQICLWRVRQHDHQDCEPRGRARENDRRMRPLPCS
jgi:hypothetical protein